MPKQTYVRTGVKSIHNNYDKEIRDYEGVDSVLSNYKIYALKSIIRQVESKLNTLESNLNNQKKTFFFKKKVINLHKIWYYDKFIVAFSVLADVFDGRTSRCLDSKRRIWAYQ